MKDEDKAKEQLLSELAEMRQRVAQFEASEVERVQTEKSPLLLDESYQRLFEFFPIGITVLDMKGVILYCNAAVYNKGSYSKDDLVGKHFSKIAPLRARDIPNFVRIFASLIRGKVPKPFEVNYQQKSGTTGWTEVSTGLIKVGEERRILVAQNDITERKQAEQTMSHERDLIQTIFENHPDFFYFKDREARFHRASKRFCDFFGLSIEDIIGKTDLDLFPKEVAKQTYSEDLHIIKTRTPLINKEESAGGVWVLTTKIPWFDKEGNILGLFGISRDITERKRAEEKEKQLQQDLILSNRLATVGEMASGIAHEINNPLTGVIGFSDLLMRKELPDDIRKDVEVIHEGAQRIASITDRMLTFAHQHEPERTSVNINDIVETTLAMRAYEMKSSNIEVTSELAPNIPLTFADAGQLQQVFLNIILNAEMEMKLAHGRGNLTVKTEKIDNTIRASFKDDGPGIPKKNLDRLFDPFFTTRDPDKGTGLGLSICYSIVTQHGGKIYARSRLDKGATFFVELPVITKEEQLKMAEPAAELSKTLSRARILVVDDDTIVQKFLTTILTEEGHQVEIVDNGDDALERVDSEDYDVILLDIKLPGASGIELYRHMQRAVKSLARRVIFITGDVMSEDTMGFLATTRAPYITKPFDGEQLKKDIDRILSQQS